MGSHLHIRIGTNYNSFSFIHFFNFISVAIIHIILKNPLDIIKLHCSPKSTFATPSFQKISDASAFKLHWLFVMFFVCLFDFFFF